MDGIEYRVRAANPPAATENLIHGDDVARRFGFQGGLVPGVTVYGYACHALVQALGPGWVEHGCAHVRFLAPCYDGEELVVAVRPAPSPSVEIEVTTGKRTCVIGSAALSPPRAEARSPSPTSRPPRRPQPEARPGPDDAFFAPGPGAGLGAHAHRPGHRRRLSHRHPRAVDVLRRRRHRAPGQLLGAANRVLTANVVLWAWLHVESEVAPPPGRLGRRGNGGPGPRSRPCSKRKGHRFVRLDVAWLAAARTVAAARHTAIWQLAGS